MSVRRIRKRTIVPCTTKRIDAENLTPVDVLGLLA